MLLSVYKELTRYESCFLSYIFYQKRCRHRLTWIRTHQFCFITNNKSGLFKKLSLTRILHYSEIDITLMYSLTYRLESVNNSTLSSSSYHINKQTDNKVESCTRHHKYIQTELSVTSTDIPIQITLRYKYKNCNMNQIVRK